MKRTIPRHQAFTFLEWHPDIPQITKQQGMMAHNWISCLKAPSPLSAQEEAKSLLGSREETHTLRELFDII